MLLSAETLLMQLVLILVLAAEALLMVALASEVLLVLSLTLAAEVLPL